MLLDGDEVRHAIDDDTCGHDRESRIKNAYRISRFSQLLAEQDHHVIVATMSLYHEIHVWNRENLPAYLEVLLNTDQKVLVERDPKGLYRRYIDGTLRNIPGMDLVPEMPRNPHLVLENGGEKHTPKKQASQIFRFCQFFFQSSKKTFE